MIDRPTDYHSKSTTDGLALLTGSTSGLWNYDLRSPISSYEVDNMLPILYRYPEKLTNAFLHSVTASLMSSVPT